MAKGRKQIGRLNILPEGQVEDNDPIKVMGIDSNGDVVYADPGSVSDITRTSQLINDGEEGTPYQVIVTDIAELESFSGEAICVLVEDSLRGGIFKYVDSGLTVDNGTIFNAIGKGSGFWQRQWGQYYGVNVLWYGADPNGVNDSAVIIEDVISKYSQSGKVFIPAGNYRCTSTIGDAGVGSTKHITNNVIIGGTLGTVINIDSSVQISSVFAFDIRGVDIEIRDITFNANLKANRGVYMRQLLTANPALRRSNIEIHNCNIKNSSSESTGAIEGSVAGIAIYGHFNNVFIHSNIITDITSQSTTLPVKGVFIDGNPTQSIPLNSKIFNNRIERVNRSISSQLDQDGIHIGGLGVYNSSFHGEVYGNTIIDAAGRMVKIQQPNAVVRDNYMELSTSFNFPSSHTGAAIDVQYSDGIVFNNILNHLNSNGNSYNALVNFTERTTDSEIHRVEVYSNKVAAANMVYFASFWEDQQSFKTPINIYDNYMIGSVNSFIYFLGDNTFINQRNINIKGNVVKNVVNTFIKSEINPITINLDYNINLGTSIPASDALNDLYLTNNVGLTNPNSYELKETGTGYQYYNAGVKTLITGNSFAMVLANGTSVDYRGSVRNSVPLTGLANVNSNILATDSILQAFGKTQGQINAINTGVNNKVTKGGDSDASKLIVGTNNLQDFEMRRNGVERILIDGFQTTISESSLSAPSVLKVFHKTNGYTGDLLQAVQLTGGTPLLVAGIRPSGRVYGAAAIDPQDFLRKGEYDAAKAIVDSALTTTQTASTLNTKYPSVPFPYVVFAPNVGSSMTYVKVNATQWMSYSGVLLS